MLTANLNSSIGGCAYGIPVKATNFRPRRELKISPLNGPSDIFTSRFRAAAHSPMRVVKIVKESLLFILQEAKNV